MELNINGKHGATRQSWSRTGIRTVYRELKSEHPKAGHDRLVRLLAERLREDDEALEAAADYVVTNCEEAENGYKRRAVAPPEQRAKAQAEKDEKVEAIKSQIMLLNLEMPNGKRMRWCTGAEMVRFGGAYTRIGKRVGSTKIVGSELSEAQVRALMK